MGENWHYSGDLGYYSPEAFTPPSHTYDIEYRFLVMQNLLRLFPEKVFCIEAQPGKWQPYEVVES